MSVKLIVRSNSNDKSEDELMHYGVMGMKWGVRRAQKLSAKASKLRAKGKIKRAEKLETKAKKQKAATARVQKDIADIYGKKAAERMKKQSTLKSFVQEDLLGQYGALKYNQFRAAGMKRGKAAVKALREDMLNTLTLGNRQHKEEFRL